MRLCFLSFMITSILYIFFIGCSNSPVSDSHENRIVVSFDTSYDIVSSSPKVVIESNVDILYKDTTIKLVPSVYDIAGDTIVVLDTVIIVEIVSITSDSLDTIVTRDTIFDEDALWEGVDTLLKVPLVYLGDTLLVNIDSVRTIATTLLKSCTVELAYDTLYNLTFSTSYNTDEDSTTELCDTILLDIMSQKYYTCDDFGTVTETKDTIGIFTDTLIVSYEYHVFNL